MHFKVTHKVKPYKDGILNITPRLQSSPVWNMLSYTEGKGCLGEKQPKQKEHLPIDQVVGAVVLFHESVRVYQNLPLPTFPSASLFHCIHPVGKVKVIYDKAGQERAQVTSLSDPPPYAPSNCMTHYIKLNMSCYPWASKQNISCKRVVRSITLFKSSSKIFSKTPNGIATDVGMPIQEGTFPLR